MPNNLAFTNAVHPENRAPESIGGGKHGTMMATIAGGKNYGIAPNADLYLLKTKNQYRSTGEERFTKHAGIQPAAIQDIFREIEANISSRLRNVPTAKSVISMSWGEYSSYPCML